jgi:hypothetical protein
MKRTKKIVFARFGGLSPVKYKKKGDGFHAPPCKKGIYAFVYPYIEIFLWSWNETKYNNVKAGKDRVRTFTYEGPIWCHFDIENHQTKGSWVLLQWDEYIKAFKKQIHKDVVFLNKDFYDKREQIKNPYKRGLGGCCSKDHLEVFIEGKNLGKIRESPNELKNRSKRGVL